MSHHDLQFFSLLGCFLGLASFVVISLIKRTRTQGIIGLAGSVLLFSGVVRGESFHDIQSMVFLEIFGAALLFASTLIAIKRSHA